MKKKLIAMLLSAAMCLSLAACGQKADTPDTTDPAEPSGDAATYTVGICQLVQHEALDAATQGFIDALNEALPGQVKIEEKNASGDSNSCATIVNGFVSEGVDLIMANATAALQAAASATSDIPVLGTSITAYGVALDIDDFSGTVGGNVSGTSDLADLSKQADRSVCCSAPASRTPVTRSRRSPRTCPPRALRPRNLPSPTPTTFPPLRRLPATGPM